MPSNFEPDRTGTIELNNESITIRIGNGRITLILWHHSNAEIISFESIEAMFGSRHHDMILNKDQIKTLALGLALIVDRMDEHADHTQDPEVLEDQAIKEADP